MGIGDLLGVTLIDVVGVGVGVGVGSRTSAADIGPAAATTAASTADPAATSIPRAQRTTHVVLQSNGTARAPSTSETKMSAADSRTRAIERSPPLPERRGLRS